MALRTIYEKKEKKKRKGRHVETITQLSAQQHEMHRLQALPELEKGLLLFCHSVVSNSLWPHGLQHATLPYPLSSHWACSNSCLLSRWSHPTISSSAVPFSSCLQSFPAAGFFFQWVSSSHQVAEVLELQYQSFEIICRIYFLWHWLVWFSSSPRDSQEFSPTPHFKSINSLMLSFLYHIHTWLNITSIHDSWKKP